MNEYPEQHSMLSFRSTITNISFDNLSSTDELFVVVLLFTCKE